MKKHLAFKLAVVLLLAVASIAHAATLATPLTSSGTSHTPTLTQTTSGAVVVVWETNVKYKLTFQQDLFARVASDGANFAPITRVVSDTAQTRQPSLLALSNGDAFLTYKDSIPTGSASDIFYQTYHAGEWSGATRLSNSPLTQSQDPASAQDTSGRVWVTWWEQLNGTRTDVFVKPLDGNAVNLSNDWSAVRHPSITTGDNGAVYVAWVDHANEGRPAVPGINVMQWDGTKWTRLPSATRDVNANFPTLAYRNGTLYLLWRGGDNPQYLYLRTWNGATWTPKRVLAQGGNLMTPRLAVTASSSIIIAYDKAGTIYLKRNDAPAQSVSAGMTGAHAPALFVDATETAHIAFEVSGLIQYAELAP